MLENGAKLFGHPIHQKMIIVWPLGLLSTAVAFDIVFLATRTHYWLEISYWMILAGVLGGLLAAVFGLIDWLAVPSGTRAKAVGLWHGVGNAVVLVLFAISWFLRINGSDYPGPAPFVLSFVGLGLALVTGWLGGELVDRLGIGVDRGAHANAPSSLSGRPATEQAPSRSRGFWWPWARPTV
jgi:uncharacterized membrane protein